MSDETATDASADDAAGIRSPHDPSGGGGAIRTSRAPTSDATAGEATAQVHALLTSQQPEEALALGTAWARNGDAVTVVLLDAATAILRPDHDAAADLAVAHAAGVRLWAHDDALAERALPAGTGSVDAVDLNAVAVLLAAPETSAQWW